MPTGSGKYGFVRRSGYPPWNGWKINFLLGFGPFLGAFAVSSQFQGILHSFMRHGPGLSRCIFYWKHGGNPASYVSLPEGSLQPWCHPVRMRVLASRGDPDAEKSGLLGLPKLISWCIVDQLKAVEDVTGDEKMPTVCYSNFVFWGLWRNMTCKPYNWFPEIFSCLIFWPVSVKELAFFLPSKSANSSAKK